MGTTQRIELYFWYDLLNTTQRIELIFNTTRSIEFFKQKFWLKEFNFFFFEHDWKNWTLFKIWLEELNIFWKNFFKMT